MARLGRGTSPAHRLHSLSVPVSRLSRQSSPVVTQGRSERCYLQSGQFELSGRLRLRHSLLGHARRQTDMGCARDPTDRVSLHSGWLFDDHCRSKQFDLHVNVDSSCWHGNHHSRSCLPVHLGFEHRHDHHGHHGCTNRHWSQGIEELAADRPVSHVLQHLRLDERERDTDTSHSLLSLCRHSSLVSHSISSISRSHGQEVGRDHGRLSMVCRSLYRLGLLRHSIVCLCPFAGRMVSRRSMHERRSSPRLDLIVGMCSPVSSAPSFCSFCSLSSSIYFNPTHRKLCQAR